MASVKDMTPYGLNLETSRQISTEDFATLVRQGCQPLVGDVLIAKDGATALDTVCVIERAVEVVLLSSVAILRPKGALVQPKFLRYYLDSDSTRAYMKGAFTTGAAIPRVVLKDFKRARIRYPDLTTQSRICSTLSAYDDVIENNTRRIAILEEMARRTYEEWFVRFRFPGHEGVRMVESEQGLVPGGWQVAQMQSVARLLSGFAFKSKTFTSTGQYGLVTIKNVHDGSFVEECTSRLPDYPANMPSHCKLKVGDILLSLTGNVGRCCLVTTGGDALNQRVAKIQPVNPADWAYVYLLFRSGDLKERLEAISSGVAQQNLSPIDSQRLPLVIPSQELRSKFCESVADMLHLVLSLHRKNTTLRTTRDLLLPKLISGELDVSDLPDQQAVAA